MGLLSEMRRRTECVRAEKEAQAQRVRKTVSEVINSDNFVISLMNNLPEVSETSIESFANRVADRLVTEVSDPVNDFMDALAVRGIPEDKVKVIVDNMCSLFNIVQPDASYSQRLEAVAVYMKQNPLMYDDLSILQ